MREIHLSALVFTHNILERKKKLKTVIRTLLFLVLGINYSTQTIAQQANDTTSKYLTTGDYLPNLPLGEMINYTGKEKTLGDFKGKLLILDFWATWCSPCVAGFPKNDELRKYFGDQIQILPITYEDAAKAGTLLQSVARDKKTGILFSVVSDKAIRALFNFKTIPHYVWIDKTGKIISQTTHDELVEEKIQAVLNGNNKVLIPKGIVTKRRNVSTQLFKIGTYLVNDKDYYVDPLTDSDIVYRSILTKSVDGLGPATSYRPHRFTAVNTTIQWLYKIVLGKLFSKQRHEFSMFLADNRVSWDIRDSALNILSHEKGAPKTTLKYIDWEKKYGYCYEIITPEYMTEREMYEVALEELNRYFKTIYGLEGTVERRKVKCMVLERVTTMDKLSSKDKNAKQKISESKYRFNISNTRFDYFLQRFSSYYLQLMPTPIVDETHINPLTLVDMDLQCNLADEMAVNNELNKYGLRMREDFREIDMVIIKQVGNPKLKLP